MSKKSKGGGLTSLEKRIVKSLLAQGKRNQDIQSDINLGRKATVNSGRITAVKQDFSQAEATEAELIEFFARKRAYDPRTNLNAYDDERLVRSREAMILAVSCFNNPAIKFKTEIFAVLANIAWTYLLQEWLSRGGVAVKKDNGLALSMKEMLSHERCNLSEATKFNIMDINRARDQVEHELLGMSDHLLFPMFQANAFNFDNALCQFFGECCGLSEDLSFSLQFSRPSIENLVQLAKGNVGSKGWLAFNRELQQERRAIIDDQEYQFSVVYTTVQSSKSKAHFKFVQSGTEEHSEISNVLVKYKPAAETHPYKPKAVVGLVRGRTGKRYSLNNHAADWRRHDVRPPKGVGNPAVTHTDYCYYHPAHGDYTYSEKWVDLLVDELKKEVSTSSTKNN